MGRSRKPGLTRPAGPSGPRWTQFRRRLFSWEPGGWGPAPACYHCGHPCAPGLGEVQHLLSPRTAPALAWDRRNLRPVHGGGARRCPVCDLACNAVSAGNLAPRDSQGRPLPFPPDFLAARIAERRAFLAAGKSPRSAREAARSAGNRAIARETPAVPRGTPATAGRAW